MEEIVDTVLQVVTVEVLNHTEEVLNHTEEDHHMVDKVLIMEEVEAMEEAQMLQITSKISLMVIKFKKLDSFKIF